MGIKIVDDIMIIENRVEQVFHPKIAGQVLKLLREAREIIKGELEDD